MAHHGGRSLIVTAVWALFTTALLISLIWTTHELRSNNPNVVNQQLVDFCYVGLWIQVSMAILAGFVSIGLMTRFPMVEHAVASISPVVDAELSRRRPLSHK
jgi:hypothetical protein